MIRDVLPSENRKLPITVIIPAFNTEKYIGEALDSIKRQTMLPAEIIVIDDGSNDRTASIAAEYDVRLRYQKRLGPSAARNNGILAATQPWVAFLDADDVWEPEKLEFQWEAVEACCDIGAVFTDFIEFDAQGASPFSFLSRLKHYKETKRLVISEGIFLFESNSLQIQFNKGNFIRTSTLMIRRDLFFEIGLFDTICIPSEDREICLRLISVAKIAVVERPLMRYRLTDFSLSSDSFKMSIAAAIVADRVSSNPERYGIFTVNYYKKEGSVYYLNAGRYAEERGEMRRAREYYFRSYRLRRGLRPLVLAILCCFPSSIHLMLRRFGRFISSFIVTRDH